MSTTEFPALKINKNLPYPGETYVHPNTTYPVPKGRIASSPQISFVGTECP